MVENAPQQSEQGEISMTDFQSIVYTFVDSKPVEVLKDIEPKEVWIRVNGEWLIFKKEDKHD